MSYRRINKITAKLIYDKGFTVYLMPCKCYFTLNSAWVNAVPVNRFRNSVVFEKVVDFFKYYNCNATLGETPHYYVSDLDYENYRKKRGS